MKCCIKNIINEIKESFALLKEALLDLRRSKWRLPTIQEVEDADFSKYEGVYRLYDVFVKDAHFDRCTSELSVINLKTKRIKRVSIYNPAYVARVRKTKEGLEWSFPFSTTTSYYNLIRYGRYR